MAHIDKANGTIREHLHATGRAVVAADEAQLRRAIDSVQWERRGFLRRLASRQAG
jgi:hypothetical protein